MPHDQSLPPQDDHAARRNERKEWASNDDERHQMQALEHARQRGKERHAKQNQAA
jgi:hypothetical protein